MEEPAAQVSSMHPLCQQDDPVNNEGHGLSYFQTNLHQSNSDELDFNLNALTHQYFCVL